MATKEIVLTFDIALMKKLERKARKLGFSNVQKYIYYLVKRALYSTKGKTSLDPRVIDPFLLKFATPTKKTYKIIRRVRPA